MTYQSHTLDKEKIFKYRSIAPYFILPLALERSHLGSQNALGDIVLCQNITKLGTKLRLEKEKM